MTTNTVGGTSTPGESASGFARADDGLQLYWRTVGSGPPMVCCNGVGVSTFFFRYIAEHYRDRFTVVLWDYRGHGRSGMPPDVQNADMTIERSTKDLRTLLETIGLADQGPVVLGHSMGCQVALDYGCHFRDCRALIPMFGTFGRPLDTFMDSPYARRVFDLIFKVTAKGTRSSARALLPLYASPLAPIVGKLTGLVDRHYVDDIDLDRYLEHLVHMDSRVFLRMVSQIADHDLADQLPQLQTPTLVIAGERDLFTPLHRSIKMRDLIPGAELFILAEASHAAIVEHPTEINQRIDRFLRERCGL